MNLAARAESQHGERSGGGSYLVGICKSVSLDLWPPEFLDVRLSRPEEQQVKNTPNVAEWQAPSIGSTGLEDPYYCHGDEYYPVRVR